jgi:sugar lactone lactonase YvrE
MLLLVAPPWAVGAEPERRPFATPELVASLPGKMAVARQGLAFSPDGRTLAFASTDVVLWEVASRQARATFRPPGKDSFTFAHLAFASDGRHLAVHSRHRVYVWDLARQRVRAELKNDTTSQLAFSPDGRTLALGGGDLAMWEWTTGAETGTLHSAATIGSVADGEIAFSPDGKAVATASAGSVRLWDVGKRRPVTTLRGEPGPYAAVAFSPDGKTLAEAQLTTVRLWDLASGRVRARWGRFRWPVTCLAFSPDGRLLAAGYHVPGVWRRGGEPGTVLFRDVAAGEQCGSMEVPGSQVNGLAFSPDGALLAVAGCEPCATLWRLGPRRGPATPPRNGPAAGGARLPDSGANISKEEAREMEALWSDLRGEDAPKAYRAVWALAGRPERAVPFLSGRLRPVAPADAQRAARLIARLDEDQPAAREQATRELRELEDLAAPALREALQRRPAPEARRRLRGLLQKLDGAPPSADTLRSLRAVEALEHMATPEAKGLLRTLAGGASGARLTQEAKASLERLRLRAGR